MEEQGGEEQWSDLPRVSWLFVWLRVEVAQAGGVIREEKGADG